MTVGFQVYLATVLIEPRGRCGIVAARMHQPDQTGETKLEVGRFYDEVGWQAGESETYEDTALWVDTRPVSREYARKCDERVKRALLASGRYFVDAGSGPVREQGYLDYSTGYAVRVCLDISKQALEEARRHLGGRGQYVMCDIAHLPLKDGSIDALLASHSVYHVPAAEQPRCFEEFQRVVKPSGAAVVVYYWGWRSLLMNLALAPYQLLLVIQRLLAHRTGSDTRLYFYPHRFQTFAPLLRVGWRLRVWRAPSVPFLRFFIHEKLGGKALLRLIFVLEERFPAFFGRYGAYPMFVIRKPPRA